MELGMKRCTDTFLQLQNSNYISLVPTSFLRRSVIWTEKEVQPFKSFPWSFSEKDNNHSCLECWESQLRFDCDSSIWEL